MEEQCNAASSSSESSEEDNEFGQHEAILAQKRNESEDLSYLDALIVRPDDDNKAMYAPFEDES